MTSSMPLKRETTVLRSLIVKMEKIEPSLHLVSVLWEESPQAKALFTQGKLLDFN